MKALRQYLSPTGARLLKQYWAVWIPTFAVMWSAVPHHLRIVFLCAVSLVWQVSLSTLTNAAPQADHEEEALRKPTRAELRTGAQAISMRHKRLRGGRLSA